MESVHGHQLIGLIVEQERALSLTEIKSLAETKIGAEAIYHTCSATGLTTDGMIGFLVDNRKLVEKGAGYVIDTGNVCDDDE